MSLNCAEQPDRAGKGSSRDWSLTFWLTFFSTLSAFVVLALIATLLYGGLASQLNSQNRLYLHDEADIVEGMLRSKASEASLAAELDKDHTGNEYVKHYIRVMDRAGRVIMETPSMEEAIPSKSMRLPLRDGRPGVDRHWRAADGRLFLASACWVDLGRASGEQGILQVAMDVTNVDQILVSYRQTIFILLALGLLLCAAVNFLIARRGMRPLREMTELVRRISATSLKERVWGKDWPLEVISLAAAMNLMLDRLEESFTRLYTSATNLTHKLRTPLTILRGEAEVALSRERTVEELQDVISSSLEEYGRLSRLGDNILFLANAETGKFQLSRAELDARTEVEKILDFYAPMAEERGVTISCCGNVTLTADASLFRKAATALLSNALTYNEPGGEVVISLSQGTGLGAEISVQDTGCGIAEMELPKIFDRFYRIYATRHLDPHGTGLGLPIARAIMELHGGTVLVDSRPDAGTTVILRFPSQSA